MKIRLKKCFLKWARLIAFAWSVVCCFLAGINGHWDECLVIMAFCFLWLLYWVQERITDKLAHHNAELKRWNTDLSKQCTTYRFISQFYLYKYLNAQNDVDFCKRKINCTDYLSKKRWFEFMIEEYKGILKERGQNV